MTLPTLDTKRLVLQEADAEGLHAAFDDSEAMRFRDFPAAREAAETAAHIRRSLAVDERWHGAWTILIRAVGSAGMINCHHREPWNRQLELGWILASAFWRRGLMTEAARAVLHHCFTEMDTHRVEAIIEPENIASRALAAKLGFVREGGLMRDRLCVEGRFRSVLMYGLLRPEWSRMVFALSPVRHWASRKIGKSANCRHRRLGRRRRAWSGMPRRNRPFVCDPVPVDAPGPPW